MSRPLRARKVAPLMTCLSAPARRRCCQAVRRGPLPPRLTVSSVARHPGQHSSAPAIRKRSQSSLPPNPQVSTPQANGCHSDKCLQFLVTCGTVPQILTAQGLQVCCCPFPIKCDAFFCTPRHSANSGGDPPPGPRGRPRRRLHRGRGRRRDRVRRPPRAGGTLRNPLPALAGR